MSNPRYLAYCKAHGKEPAAMRAHDKERFPGGFMAGFIIWLRQQWILWDAGLGADYRKRFGSYRCQEEHAAFDRWLHTAMRVLEEIGLE